MDKFMQSVSAAITTIAPRTQYAIIALIFTGAIAALFSVSDKVAVMRSEHDVLAKRLAQYGDGIDVPLWQARVAASSTANTAWQSLYWEGDKSGIIAAQIRTALSDIGQRALLERTSIDVDPIAVDIGPIKALRFQMIGRSSDAIDIVNALSAIAATRPALTAKDLSFNVREDDSGAFTVSGLAYIKLSEESVAESGTGDPR